MGTHGRSNGRTLETRLQLWRKRFQEFSSESCTVDQFCEQVGVMAATFYYWRKKLADRDEIRLSSLRSESGRPDSVSRQSRPAVKAAARFESFVPVQIVRAAEFNSEVVGSSAVSRTGVDSDHRSGSDCGSHRAGLSVES